MQEVLILEISVAVENIKPNLVENLYETMIDLGFQFKAGYKKMGAYSLEYIIRATQEKLLYHSQWSELLDLQVLFGSKVFRKIRGLWDQRTTEVRFVLLIEADILCEPDGKEFITERLGELKNLAIAIWEGNPINAVQAFIADRGFNLSSINQGLDILFNPFAILSKDAYKRFAPSYFKNCNITELKNKGVMVSEKNNLNKNYEAEKEETLLSKEFFAEKLVTTFPELQPMLEEHMADYGELLGHLFFADAINRPLTELLQANIEIEKIKLYIELIEDMYKSGDDSVQNIIFVTVLEYLIDDDLVLRNAYTYFSQELIEVSRRVERYWGRI